MDNTPLISFIVPSYNFEKYIGKCIESILAQTYSNLELIIVNDGSTDNSCLIIDEYAKKDARITAIHKTNEGVSIARNTGLNKSKGKYVCFVDADDFISSDFAEYMINLAESYDAEFCISSECFTRKGEQQTSNVSNKSINAEQATALLLSPALIVGSWNKLFKKEVLINNDIKFSSNLFYGEGLRFITQVAQVCKKIAVTNYKMYYYRRNNYSSATSKFNFEKFENGYLSLKVIEANLTICTPNVLTMLGWHKCQFKMGTVVRIITANKTNEYREYYNEALQYVRNNFYKYLFIKDISLYKKGLLVGCAIWPSFMAKMDNYRRSKISKYSFD